MSNSIVFKKKIYELRIYAIKESLVSNKFVKCTIKKSFVWASPRMMN